MQSTRSQAYAYLALESHSIRQTCKKAHSNGLLLVDWENRRLVKSVGQQPCGLHAIALEWETMTGGDPSVRDDREFESVLATAAEMLTVEGLSDAAEILRTAEARVEETGYDNWNGGTAFWTIYLPVPPADYARLGARRSQLEEQIGNRVSAAIAQLSSDSYSISIVPQLSAKADWRQSGNELPRGVRTDIIDGLKMDGVVYNGQLDDVEFLQRIFDLKQLPSSDPRFKDAAGDIWQHTINNDDWDRDWVFGDKRFDLVGGPTETFLRFLCEMIHPLVRPDRDEALRLANHFNDALRSEGWELFEEQRIAGRPRFAYRAISDNGTHAVSRARNVADALEAGWMAREIERLERSIESDPAMAIGTAKDLVESCIKTILEKRNIPFNRSDDIGDLTKLLTKTLRLVPDDIPDAAKGAKNIKVILNNLASITHNLAELRGFYGSGHGRAGNHRGLESRHARLAAGAAATFVDFISATHRQRDEQVGTTSERLPQKPRA